METHGSAQFCFTRKLLLLKRDLRTLNLLHFSHISSRVSRVKEELQTAFSSLNQNPHNEDLQNEVVRLKHQGEWLAKAELAFLTQKAKAHYFHNCDKSTAYFHALIRKQAIKNQIVSITKADGTCTSSVQEMGEEFINFYQQLLGSYTPINHEEWNHVAMGAKVSSEDQTSLCLPITDPEIKSALWSIGENKAPGPDGYSAGFFKKSWPIIGDDLCTAVKEFFASGQLLKQMNHALLVLIPKHANANRVEEFRPIACCNVLYNIISKILTNRIAPILNSLIDPSQAAFLQGRLMRDNIFLVHELLQQYTRKRISPRCFFQVDLRKAYDSVEWTFLEGMLRALSFPNRFITWIMQCVSTASYSISLNGQLFGHFNGMRGLRQGDPLSPHLFVICLEFLSRQLYHLPATPGFSLHPRCHGLNITHLAFVDDLILLARADIMSVSLLLDCLQNFSARSGLSISFAKSKFFLAGADEHMAEHIEAMSGFPRGTFPLKYLGVPLAISRLTYIHFKPLIDRIGSYIDGWMRKTLSYAGRLELIKSVLQGVDCFWLSIFPIPACVTDAIIKMCRCFLFGANVKNPPVSWNVVSAPKNEGGLGLFHLPSWNQALLFSNIWNIHVERQSLWIKWVHHYYLRGSSIWTWQPKKEDSVFMKHMIHTRDRLLLHAGSLDQLLAIINRLGGPRQSTTALFYDLLRSKRQHRYWSSSIWHSQLQPKLSFIL
ncbi:hypothetical protein Dimus_037926 [Dionaea muscipula]